MRSVNNEALWTLFQVDQQRITALDGMMIAIRGWTVTVVSAIAGFALSRDDPAMLLAGTAGTILFALLDLRYRRTQLLHADRSDRVEQEIAPDYRLRGQDSAPGSEDSRLRRYRSSLSFYAVVILTQVALLLVI
ncbi:MAG: hypothetical protein ACR2QK_21565 [Acidimicrobiales bacterium]